MKIKHPEVKALDIFHEALNNISTFSFPDTMARKEKAKANCFILIQNIKIALYEATAIDNVPARAYKMTEAYYTQIQIIISKF